VTASTCRARSSSVAWALLAASFRCGQAILGASSPPCRAPFQLPSAQVSRRLARVSRRLCFQAASARAGSTGVAHERDIGADKLHLPGGSPRRSDRKRALTVQPRRRSGRIPASLAGSFGFVTCSLSGFFALSGGRRATATGRISGEGIDSVLRLPRPLLRYGLERPGLGFVRGSCPDLIPRRSKSIEPSPLVNRGIGIRLVLHLD
jgi:hypothetical protein